MISSADSGLRQEETQDSPNLASTTNSAPVASQSRSISSATASSSSSSGSHEKRTNNKGKGSKMIQKRAFMKTVDVSIPHVPLPLMLTLEQFDQQRDRWPGHGKHIVGVFSPTAFLLYQAFNDQIADYAIANQKFEGAPGYSESRMTWTKPNFLWMMYRSNWAKRANQTRILGIWLKLDSFHELLRSTRKTIDKGKDTKHGAISSGAVTIQWDPDHTPNGDEMTKRALQIGVKSVSWWKTGERFESIVDMTPLVSSLRDHAKTKNGLYPKLFTPQEKLYLLPVDLIPVVSTDTSQTDLKLEQDFFDINVPTAVEPGSKPTVL